MLVLHFLPICLDESSFLVVNIAVSFNCLVDATSGGISGSAHVAENKKEKIVLLKGRARVDSNVSI